MTRKQYSQGTKLTTKDTKDQERDSKSKEGHKRRDQGLPKGALPMGKKKKTPRDTKKGPEIRKRTSQVY